MSMVHVLQLLVSKIKILVITVFMKILQVNEVIAYGACIDVKPY